MKNLFLDKNTTIAIIGFGRFGQLLVKVLLKHSKANLTLVTSKKTTLSHKNLAVASIKKLREADVIIPCVPISSFESVIKQIAPLIKKGAVIVDVCSVKILPVQIMKKHLPNSVQIIASHPMFGPDSFRIKKSLQGLRLVLGNITAKKSVYLQTRSFFKNLGLTIIELSPAQHDKYMAHTLGYSYLVGKIAQKMGIKKTPIDTYDFELLLEHVGIVKSDSDQLFLDMQTKNPFAKDVQAKYQQTTVNLLKEIESAKLGYS
ncbi:MAG: prephenate dehydrogenase/arogenate dehydrogenase family protein [Candidatus Levybacteria bacterium]|nr:prephenate dehydrogenase/arogenate dehydrogenase family protein [Candidatus Levybacteria bacterium]